MIEMIKKLLFSIVVAFASVAGSAQPKIEFDSRSIDFGTVVEGTICKHRFYYKNTGNQPFIISDVSVTCGCTVPQWSRNPLQSGDTASIYIEFSTHNKLGNVAKGVNLMTNCPDPEIGLIILANIISDSNFIPIKDSLSYKPLKVVTYKSYTQVVTPLKLFAKKGFKGNEGDAENLIRKIMKDTDQLLFNNVWFTKESGNVVANMMDKNLMPTFIALFKKELLNKKRLKYWVSKLNEI
jgi:hypothetical protein